ncbi:hypothetical protein PoB_004229000 [Plakobranchus ocellatus]|uniref:Uncharacterized protein n=1 Tax=Plakobranchus ocellatus TaxID=259542 RepID=A0AAV4B8D0_9GAST|nr:hypothetical protein PoB_004229000 [Plakobranchus ocellatus]
MMICRVALEWNIMSGRTPLSCMTTGCLFHSRRSAINSQSSHPLNTHARGTSMPGFGSTLQCDNVNTTALAFGWTEGPFAPHIALTSSCNTLLCRHVYLP